MSALQEMDVELDAIARQSVIDHDSEIITYQENTGLFVSAFRRIGSMGKILLTIGAPLALVIITAGISFWGLGHISESLASGDQEHLAAAAQEVKLLRNMMAGSVVVGILLTMTLFHLIRADITGTSRQLLDCMRRIADGNSNVEVPHRDRSDEYGEFGAEIERMRIASMAFKRLSTESAESAVKRLKEQEELEAERERIRIEREEMLRDLATQFEGTVGDVVNGVAAASTELQNTSREMAETAKAANSRTEQVTVAMSEANSGATAAAAASDEFAMSIGEISRQAASSAEMARHATQAATEADSTISELSSSADQVGEIVDLISTIAQRTNLLALNASIEAARGGEAGRGFAVVASEVKELAMQTSRATEQVAEQIRAMQDRTGASVSALRSIIEQVQQLENTSVSIASAVDQQSVAGQDLARSIDLAARGTEEVSTHIDDVREMSLSTGAAATQVLNSASELEIQAETLRGQVSQFLAKIRTG